MEVGGAGARAALGDLGALAGRANDIVGIDFAHGPAENGFGDYMRPVGIAGVVAAARVCGGDPFV